MNSLLAIIDNYKAQIDEFRPFEGHLLREMQAFYRVGLVYSSNAIEGVSYTLSETKVLLEDGLTAGGRPLRDAFAVIGHARAYDHMFSLLRRSSITEDDVKTFHSFLEGGLEYNFPTGRYREQSVFISGSKYPVTAHVDIPSAMRAVFADFNSTMSQGSTHPVVLAAMLHKELAFIHPFIDGNGRVARLAMNTVLIQNGYTPAYISPMLRTEYIGHLEHAHREDSPFIQFIGLCVIESQKELLRMLKGVTLDESENVRPCGPKC